MMKKIILFGGIGVAVLAAFLVVLFVDEFYILQL